MDKKRTPLWLIAQDVTKISFWIFCILWHILLITVFLNMKLNGNILIIIPGVVLSGMLLLIATFAWMGVWDERKLDKPDKSTIFQKYISLKLRLLRGWGMLFRTLFISLIGIVGYHWIDPPLIGDKPFLDLTLRQFFGNLLASLFVIGCIVWFFRFPKNKSHICTDDPTQNSYVLWGIFGVLLLVLTTAIVAYGGMLMRQ